MVKNNCVKCKCSAMVKNIIQIIKLPLVFGIIPVSMLVWGIICRPFVFDVISNNIELFINCVEMFLLMLTFYVIIKFKM